MTRYWLRDLQGRVLGPTTLDIARALLASGRLRNVESVSVDGVLFMPLSDVTELAAAVPAAVPPSDVEARARRIRDELAEMKTKPIHEVLGAPEGATVADLRAAFLKRVKEYHPARLPPDTAPALRAACVETFQYLGALMAQAEKASAAGAPGSARPPGVAAAPAARATTPGPSAGAYRPEDFVGFERRDLDRVEVRLTVGLRQVGVFVDHPMMNLSRGGFYVQTETPPALGTALDVRIDLTEPPTEIRARGRVAWSNAPGGRSAPGAGISFTQIAKEDLAALESFVKRGLAARGKR